MLEQPTPTGMRGAPNRAHAAWWRTPLGWLSPAGARGRLAIVMFHRVHREPDPLFPGEMHATAFRARLGWLREWFNVLPLEEAVVALTHGTLPSRALAITFDDGYADNAQVALPILGELGLTATFFITTGYLDGGRMWNDSVIEAIRRAPGSSLDLAFVGLGRFDITTHEGRRTTIDRVLRALKHLPPDEREARVDTVMNLAGAVVPGDLMMTSVDVQHVASAGMGVGAHTVRHPILASLDDTAARQEIGESRERLQALLRQPVRLFAYPNGKPNDDYGARDVGLVRSFGFTAAFSTAWGAARRGDDLHELPRFTPWDRSPMRWGARLARNYLVPIERAAA